MQEDAKATRTELKAARGQLLSLEAGSLAASGRALPNGLQLVTKRLTEGDAGDARLLAQKIAEARADAVAVVVHEGAQATLVITRGKDAGAVDAASALKAALG